MAKLNSACIKLVWVLATLAGTSVQAQTDRLGDDYGFLPLEIYQLGDRISGLTAADLDGDGIRDLIIADNARSRIDLLLSTPGPDQREGFANLNEPNVLRDARRLRLQSVPVDRELISLQTGDWNHDGQIDLAYYGSGDQVTILINQGAARFQRSARLRNIDALRNSTSLLADDLDDDGQIDLMLLAEESIFTLRNRGDARFADPVPITHTADSPRRVVLADVNGDQHRDLAIFNASRRDPLHIRPGLGEGRFGPEAQFEIEPGRAFDWADLDGQPGEELLIINSATGRLQTLTLTDQRDPDGASEDSARVDYFPLPREGTRGRTLDLGDVDGDGLEDVLVSDPANAQLLLFLQSQNGGLAVSQAYPSLIDVGTVCLRDLDGDGQDEILVLSTSEKLIGLSRYQDGRLTYPTTLPLQGEPLAMDVGDLDGDGQWEVAYITQAEDDQYLLQALKVQADGSVKPATWDDAQSVALKGLRARPSALKFIDLDGDQVQDILIFKAFGSPIVLQSQADRQPREVTNLGPLASIDSSGIASAQYQDRQRVFVSQNNLARTVQLDDRGTWQILDQFNSEQSSARIEAATAIDLIGDQRQEILLWNRSDRSLLILEPGENSLYSPGATLPIGEIDFLGLRIADLNADNRPDLVVVGADAFAVILAGSTPQRFKVISNYTSLRQNVRFADLKVIDINGDRQDDVILVDLRENRLEILAQPEPLSFRLALGFKVFEEKSFNPSDLTEPREMIATDLNGDGLNDLALVVHDRILVYRQDDGRPQDEPVDQDQP